MTAFSRHLAAGEYLFREGDPPDCAYVVDQGQIEISTEKDGRKLVLSHLGPGDLLGEMAVLDDSPRTADAMAISDCRLTEIRRDQIQERLAETDSIIRTLMLGLLQRYRLGLSIARGRASHTDARLQASSHSDKATEKMRLESQLIAALAAETLAVVYQPIYDLKLARVCGFEALIRWDHPERGPISPGEFIALAEETSLIVPVGRYVLQQSCATLARFRSVHDDFYISVNVSARQSASMDFLDLVQAELARHGLETRHLRLEITESLTLDYRQVSALIARCHEIGLKVALDDFGTGYSCLGHLHQLDFDVVKIDQGFTRQMLDSMRVSALVCGIVSMIHAIDAQIIAEGVESQAQGKALAELGVRFLQGWLVGKPLPADRIPASLAMPPLDIHWIEPPPPATLG
ncbi:MAG: EAL domain-containing protein [Xanthomonadales bacterium]|jgi:EAL domain-containing protein (putative c-di-GMP-specific phosphodiesterase class I)|nr:EAL domain-containing protein [Xanthomonadales bacterium]